MNAPTRRALLGGAIGLAVVPAVAQAEGVTVTVMPSSHPDAELIAACTEYLHIQRAFEAYYEALPGDRERDDACGSAMLDPLDSLVERIVAARAVTAEGHMARAQCAAFHWIPGARVCQDDPDGASEDRFIAAGLRDLVAMERGGGNRRTAAPEGVAVTAIPSADAQLLAACAEFDVWERRLLATDFEAAGDDTPAGRAADAEQRLCLDAQEALVDRMCAAHPSTREGHAARARSLTLWDMDLLDRADYPGDRLTAAIVRDLIA